MGRAVPMHLRLHACSLRIRNPSSLFSCFSRAFLMLFSCFSRAFLVFSRAGVHNVLHGDWQQEQQRSPQERVAAVRTYWETLPLEERVQLLSIPLEELRQKAKDLAARQNGEGGTSTKGETRNLSCLLQVILVTMGDPVSCLPLLPSRVSFWCPFWCVCLQVQGFFLVFFLLCMLTGLSYFSCQPG
jgi:hypothetical protein